MFTNVSFIHFIIFIFIINSNNISKNISNNHLRDGLGSNICRVNYCATNYGSVADDLATYVVYFYHDKSTLNLRV